MNKAMTATVDFSIGSDWVISNEIGTATYRVSSIEPDRDPSYFYRLTLVARTGMYATDPHVEIGQTIDVERAWFSRRDIRTTKEAR